MFVPLFPVAQTMPSSCFKIVDDLVRIVSPATTRIHDPRPLDDAYQPVDAVVVTTRHL